jgi:hypothetical protein
MDVIGMKPLHDLHPGELAVTYATIIDHSRSLGRLMAVVPQEQLDPDYLTKELRERSIDWDMLIG